MRLLTTILLIATLTIGTTTAASATPWRNRECRYQYADQLTGWSSLEVKNTIQCSANKWGVDVSTAVDIAQRESGLGQYATNSYSGACGPFQHVPRYFPARLAAVPSRMKPWGTSCYNARSNVLAALWLMHTSGFGAWSL